MPDLSRLIAGGAVGTGVFHLVALLSAGMSQNITLMAAILKPMEHLDFTASYLAAGAITGAAVAFLAFAKR